MTSSTDCEQFIPLRKKQLLELLCRDPALSPEDQSQFRQFSRLLEATFHFEFHSRLEELKDAYASFDPDADTQQPEPLDAASAEQRLALLFDKFVALLERANFRR